MKRVRVSAALLAIILMVQSLSGSVWAAGEQENANVWSLTGKIFADVDRDGTYSGTDQNLEGMILRLYDAKAYDEGKREVLEEACTDTQGKYSFEKLPEKDYRLELYVPDDAKDKELYHGFVPDSFQEKMEQGTEEYELILPGADDSWIEAIPVLAVNSERELDWGIVKDEPETLTNEDEPEVTTNTDEPEATTNTDEPEAAVNHNETDKSQKESEDLNVYYKEGAGLDILGKKNPQFVVEAAPVENGRIIITLPPFFDLAATPSSTDEYEVQISKSAPMTEADGPGVAGETRKVISLTYKRVSATVTAQFEMKLKDTKLINDAMIKAGDQPDQIPLNLDVELTSGNAEVAKEQIVNTSALPDPAELQLPYDGTEKLGYDKHSYYTKNENYYVVGQYQEESNITLSGYHYPYTEISLLVPIDQDSKISKFNYGINDSNYEWEKISTVTYEDKTYLKGSLDEKRDGKYGSMLGEEFAQYTTSAVEFNPTYIRMIFGDEINIGDTISFDNPVLLQYTYKGQTYTKKLYQLNDINILGTYEPEINKSNNYKVLCGDNLNVSTGVTNSNTELYPIQRENVQYEITYPYEVQPQSIATLSSGNVNTFNIEYVLVDAAGNETTKTASNVSSGYRFEIGEGERVETVRILNFDLGVKDTFTFTAATKTMEKSEDGTPITTDKTVKATATLKYPEKTDTEEIPITLQARKDNLTATERPAEVVMDESGKNEWTGGVITLSERISSDHTKSYENSRFELQADPQITSKIVGYHFQYSSKIKDTITICYTTNRGSKEISLPADEAETRPTDYNVMLDLEEGEYVKSLELDVGTLTENMLSTYKPFCFSPILNSKRTYYGEEGKEQPLTFDQPLSMTYKFTTDSPPAQYMTTEKMTTSVTYRTHYEFEVIQHTNPGYTVKESAYRGEEVTLNIKLPVYQYNNKTYSALLNSYGASGNGRYLDTSLKYRKQLLYIEMESGFEILGLNNIPNYTLVERRALDNGNRLFIFQVDYTEGDIQAEIYIRPDAKTEKLYPIAGIGITYQKYLQECFPDYPDCDKEKNEKPYQIVTLKNENVKQFPANWNIAEAEQEVGFYREYGENNRNCSSVQVQTVNTAVTDLFATMDQALKGEKLAFYEAERESLGFTAFIAPSSNTEVKDYTAVFTIPKEKEKIQGDGATYTAEYTLYASGEMKIYLSGKEVDLSQSGITITYQDENGNPVTPSQPEDYDNIRTVTIHFDTLESQNVYELAMPLTADPKSAETTKVMSSYIGHYNQTGAGNKVYMTPLTYNYNSYELSNYFGLDKEENGGAAPLPTAHTMKIYDEKWNEIAEKKFSPNDSAYTSSWQFNGNGKMPKYITFSLEDDRESYYPTLNRSLSDLPSENNEHQFADGSKVWYLEIEEYDLIHPDSLSSKCDALFVHLPTVAAEDATLALGNEEKLIYQISQSVNENIVSQYKVQVELADANSNVAEIIQKDDGFYAKGKSKGEVSYIVTVTNKQGKQISAEANIQVGEWYDLLPHVGGSGAWKFALFGGILVFGGWMLLRNRTGRRREK